MNIPSTLSPRALLAAALLVALAAQAGSNDKGGSKLNGEVYTWSRYNLTFEVPKGGKVTHNSATAFEVRWHDFTVTVRLYDKTGVDDDYIKYNLKKSAAGYNMFDTQTRKSSMEGFKGYYLTGALPDGSRACLTNVVSKKSNLLVVIEINYLMGQEEIVNQVLASFVEGKKQKVKKPKQKIQKEGEPEKPIKPGTTQGEQRLYEI